MAGGVAGFDLALIMRGRYPDAARDRLARGGSYSGRFLCSPKICRLCPALFASFGPPEFKCQTVGSVRQLHREAFAFASSRGRYRSTSVQPLNRINLNCLLRTPSSATIAAIMPGNGEGRRMSTNMQ